MRDAIQGIEDVQTHSAQRSFWWTVGALLESIVENGVESGFGIKQLCGRVDLQIRRFVEGSAKVADRMRREVLYYVAISAPVGPQVQAVQRAYRLPGLIPSAEVLSADVVRVQPLLREARDLLSSTKDLWLKLTGGRPENLPKLKQNLSQLRDKTAAIGEPSLSRLAATLASRLDKIGAAAVPEAMAMEYATAILLAESAIENFASRSPEFPKQVDAMIARLDAAQQNKPIAGAASAPLLDEMARRAQERLLLAQVAREIQANLRHIEQVLDAFFRDHSKRAELATLAHDSKQIAGALKMLGLDRAEQLLALCQQQIDEYAKPDTPVENEDLELLAESLSGLGFYIEAVEQQRPDREQADRAAAGAAAGHRASRRCRGRHRRDRRRRFAGRAAGDAGRVSAGAGRRAGARASCGRPDHAQGRRQAPRRRAPGAGRRRGAGRAFASGHGRRHRGAAGSRGGDLRDPVGGAGTRAVRGNAYVCSRPTPRSSTPSCSISI